METQQEFENMFVEIRGKMRSLRGKLDTYLAIERPMVFDGFTPSEVKNMREMRKILNRALMVLDRYEDMKACNEEMERTQEWLWDLTRRVGAHEK